MTDSPSRDPDNGVVTYTVKELLAQIKETQTANHATVMAALDGKADKADLAALGDRLEHVEARTATLEQREQVRTNDEVRADKRGDRRWMALSVLAVILAAVLSGVITAVLA